MSRIKKHSAEIERSLFAGVLIDPSMLDRVCELTTGAQFTDSVLGQAFDLVADRYAARLPVNDITVLVPEFRKAGILDALGGSAGLAKLAAEAPTAAHVIYHAGEVNRLFRLRRIAGLVSEIDCQLDDPAADPDELISKIEAKSIDVTAQGRDEVVSLSEMMMHLADKLDADRAQGTISGVPTGFESVDETTGGMFAGDSIVLAARTSIGKTAMGMQIAMNAATSGQVVLVLSLEMKELQLAQRIAAGQVGVSLVDQRTGNHTSQDSDRIRDFAHVHRETRLMIKPARRATVAQIGGYARSVKATIGLDLIVIDYLQLIAPRDRRPNRTEQVTEISNEIKTLATELDIPILSLAQLNRQGEGEEPKLSHLRESGAIEQDADGVWFLHRQRDSAETQFIIEKNRQGPRGVVQMVFDANRCEFHEPVVTEHPGFHTEFESYASS
ncbi:replicative DNA helicase [Planctomycetes bacterium TBK1r]|uniref:DNA 5'-3' helicase n=1 Tax=Stieleria magnilauensis TaxID=2527963 RepID=A0ABX5Y2A0_9BACT|nr:Replicative DNA helicase [Planctomycetes bacterium TBK1r]